MKIGVSGDVTGFSMPTGRTANKRGFGPSTKITPSARTLNSSTPSHKHFGPFWGYLREGPRIWKKPYKNRGFGVCWRRLREGYFKEKNKSGNLVPYVRGFGPPKPGISYASCWTGFPCLKCSVLQREAFFCKKKSLQGTKSPSYSICIYIYAVESKFGPRFGFFWVKTWSKVASKLGPRFFFACFSPVL